MNFKMLLRIVVFLAILLVVLYIGMENQESSHMFVLRHRLDAPAAILYFGIFAVGVLGGAILNAGGGGRRSASKDR